MITNSSNDYESSLSFTNDEVDIAKIPQYQNRPFQKLEPAYLKVSLSAVAVFYLVLWVIFFSLKYVFKVEALIEIDVYIMIALLMLMVFSLIMSYLGFFKKSYAIRQFDIIYNQGLIWHTSTIVPFNRVQHCEVSQGPIERLFGLAELKVFTAGGSSSDLKIEGLTKTHAHQLKDYITLRTGLDEEE